MLPVIETFTEDLKQVNTLMQLATVTRNILQKLTIKDIQVVTLPDNYFKFKFITEDGSTIETNSVFIGESISIDDALSVISTNPVQNKIITAAINTLQANELPAAQRAFVTNEYTKTLGPDGRILHASDLKKSLIAFFSSNGSQLIPYGSGLPSGCYLSCQGSYELDLNAMVIRFKMSLWVHGNVSDLSSAEFRMFTPAQLLSILNIPYSFDASRGTFGMWHYTNAADNPTGTNFGTCFHIIADGYYSASRAYDANTASAIGAWGMKELFEGTSGISVDFVMPII